MGLEKKEIEDFFKLHRHLMFFANTKKNLIKNISSIDDFKGPILEQIVKLRNYVVKNPELIDEFTSKNPFNLQEDELETIKGWKKGVHGMLFIVKYDGELTVFYHPETKKCYGALYLLDPIKDLVGSRLPVIVETWLIPYKGKIIYDSIIAPYNISMGRGMRNSVKSEYEESILRNGIITSFDSTKEKTTSDSELLKFYMKSEANRERYWKEIDRLSKKPELASIYNQEVGRIDSRYIKKMLKTGGVKNGWFGVFNGVVVASGRNKKELLENIENILPDKKELVFVFKV